MRSRSLSLTPAHCMAVRHSLRTVWMMSANVRSALSLLSKKRPGRSLAKAPPRAPCAMKKTQGYAAWRRRSKVHCFSWDDVDLLPDLARLRFVLDHLPDEDAIAALERMRGRGRNDFPVRTLWRVVLQHPTDMSLLRKLGRNPPLPSLCGFEVLDQQPAPVVRARGTRTGALDAGGRSDRGTAPWSGSTYASTTVSASSTGPSETRAGRWRGRLGDGGDDGHGTGRLGQGPRANVVPIQAIPAQTADGRFVPIERGASSTGNSVRPNAGKTHSAHRSG